MWKVTNTSTDRSKAMQHRTAPRMEMEPNVAGARLFLKSARNITDKQYEIDKTRLNQMVKHGIIELERDLVAGLPCLADLVEAAIVLAEGEVAVVELGGYEPRVGRITELDGERFALGLFEADFDLRANRVVSSYLDFRPAE